MESLFIVITSNTGHNPETTYQVFRSRAAALEYMKSNYDLTLDILKQQQALEQLDIMETEYRILFAEQMSIHYIDYQEPADTEETITWKLVPATWGD